MIQSYTVNGKFSGSNWRLHADGIDRKREMQEIPNLPKLTQDASLTGGVFGCKNI